MAKRLSLLPNFFISLSSSVRKRETTTKKKNLLNHHHRVVTTTANNKTTAFESVAASDDFVDDFARSSSTRGAVMNEENVVHRRKRKDENDDFSPLFERARRCFQTEFPNLVQIRGKGETQRWWERKSQKVGRERVEVTTRTVILRPKPGAKRGRIDGESTDHVRFWRHDCALFERALHAEASVSRRVSARTC